MVTAALRTWPHLPGTRPAPRWLWVVTLTVLVVLTIIRVAVFSSLDLRTDEAYYWTWSQQPALSFLDQPPMVAWFVRAGTLLFGDTPFGARFTHLLALPLIELVFADIARRRSGSMSAGLLVVLAMEATVNFGVTAAIVEPSIPLLVFAGLLFWTILRLEESRDPRWWLLVGLFGGLALLSKFTVVFFAPAIAIYLLASARNRRWLLSPWLWGGAVLALLVFMPVLIWNARHQWAAFAFQSARATAEGGLDWANFGNYLATDLAFGGLLLALVVICGSVVGAWRFWRARDPFGLALAAAFLVPLLYLGERSLHLSINPSWPIIMWPFGIATLAIVATHPASGALFRRSAAIGIVTGLPIVVALLLHGVLGNGVWLGNRDPIGADSGYAELAARVLATAKAHGATWIATSDYRTYAALRWHLGRDLPVVEVVERSRFLDFTPQDLTRIANQPGLYVFAGNGNPLVEAATRGHNEALGHFDRLWRGEIMGGVNLELIQHWTPPLDPAPGTPFYNWAALT